MIKRDVLNVKLAKKDTLIQRNLRSTEEFTAAEKSILCVAYVTRDLLSYIVLKIIDYLTLKDCTLVKDLMCVIFATRALLNSIALNLIEHLTKSVIEALTLEKKNLLSVGFAKRAFFD